MKVLFLASTVLAMAGAAAIGGPAAAVEGPAAKVVAVSATSASVSVSGFPASTELDLVQCAVTPTATVCSLENAEARTNASGGASANVRASKKFSGLDTETLEPADADCGASACVVRVATVPDDDTSQPVTADAVLKYSLR